MTKLSFFVIFFLLFGNICLASDWMPYHPVSPSIVTTYQVQPIATQPHYNVFITQPRTPILVYELTPYVFNKPIIIERHGIFCQYKTIVYEPSVVWFYQGIWK